ncbi:DUF6289 family protein [Micromonospora echinofusca]|uniref:Secreted protein n=1 Tax=Micromonospora echinofusca TaxID=47858 RepID=A0ABS3VXT6_MICEH|nr:DUF6289 family protein [Micromonospora echinofusca]MBO4209179.1 hypothetical protein [Micromonospora echinofusca]
MLRRTLAAATLGVAAIAVLPGAPAQARACMIDHQCTTYYYSDSSKTTIVGSLYEECDGSRYQWGTRTGYLTFTEVPC